MNSELRRSFKEKTREKLTFPFGLGRRANTTDGISVHPNETPSSTHPKMADADIIETATEATDAITSTLQTSLFLDSLPNTKIMQRSASEKSSKDKRRTRSGAQPKGTVSYEVTGQDTLASIAAQFETTTSELKKLNRLMTSMIFPGQVLYVPDKDYIPSPQSTPQSPVAPGNMSISSDTTSPPPVDGTTSPSYAGKPAFDLKLKSLSKGPGHAERQKSGDSGDEFVEKFIKVSVKHITDGQGVVSGVLLVTPNAIMFDPKMSDPLVVERGPEEYGMIAPMDTIISAAMYSDISAMNKQNRSRGPDGEEPVEVYHDKTCPLYKQRHSVVEPAFNCQTETLSAIDILPEPSDRFFKSESVCSCGAMDMSPDIRDRSRVTSPNPSCVVTLSGLPAKVGFTEPINEEPTDSEDKQEAETCIDTIDVHTDSLSDQTTNMLCVVSDDDVLLQVAIGTESSYILQHLTEDLSHVTMSSEDTGSEVAPQVEETSNQTAVQVEKTGINATVQVEGTSINATVQVEGTSINATVQVEDIWLDDGKLSCSSAGLSSPTLLSTNAATHTDNTPDRSSSNRTPSPTNVKSDLSIPRDTGGSPRSSPKEHGLFSRTLESLSSLGSSFPGSPNLSSLATGLFSWSHEEQQDSLRDKSQEDEVFVEPESTDGLRTDGARTDSARSDCSRTDSTRSDGTRSKTFKLHGDIPVENTIKLYSSNMFKDLSALEMIPRPATHYEDLPMYLCLRVGKPSNRKVSKTCPIESYMKQKHKPEYWFCIPRTKVDPLYAFFLQWSPNIYGSDTEVDPKERGFVVVNDSDEETDIDIVDEYFDKMTSNSHHMSKGWEIVNLEEARRRLSFAEVENLPLPEMSDESMILQDMIHIRRLCLHLPPRAEGYPWRLIYSSDKHGFSLKTLYRNMHKVDSPILLVVKDTRSQVFGAMLPCAVVMSDHFYGTGESYLFTFYPEFKRFRWTGANNFFIKGNPDSLSIGASNGLFGLWFDGDLYHGRTQSCETYDNELLTETEDFVIKAVEAWGFV